MNPRDLLKALNDPDQPHDHSLTNHLKLIREDIENLDEIIRDHSKKLECAKQERETLVRVMHILEVALSKGE